jgi:hypothetical protein
MSKETVPESSSDHTAVSSVQWQSVSYRAAYTRAQFISTSRFFYCPAQCPPAPLSAPKQRYVCGRSWLVVRGCSRVLQRMVCCTESHLKITVFWNATPCRLFWSYYCHVHSERTSCPEDGSSKFLRQIGIFFCNSMQKTFLTRRSMFLRNFVIICQTIRPHSPEDSTRIIVT